MFEVYFNNTKHQLMCLKLRHG